MRQFLKLSKSQKTHARTKRFGHRRLIRRALGSFAGKTQFHRRKTCRQLSKSLQQEVDALALDHLTTKEKSHSLIIRRLSLVALNGHEGRHIAYIREVPDRTAGPG